MKIRVFRAVVIIIALGISVSGQDVPSKTIEEQQAELRKQAVAYLHDTALEINTLRTNENRISFSSELANLMWLYDESGARKMFSRVADSYVQLLSENNSTLLALGGMDDSVENLGGFGSSPNEKQKALRKIYKAREVREIVAVAIAEHDPQTAYDFVVRTTTIVTDKKLAGLFEEQNEKLEKEIVAKMSVRDVESSLKYARTALKRGFNEEFVRLAQKVYKKDPEAAIAFGKELLEKVRSKASPETESISHMYSILDAVDSDDEELKPGQKPLFAKSDLAALAELFAANILRADEFQLWMLDSYVQKIEEYSPALANQVKSKYADKEDDGKSKFGEFIGMPIPGADSGEDGPPELSPSQRAAVARREEQEELMKEVMESKDKELSREEKARFIQRARRIVREMDDSTLKVMALSALAGQVKRMGDSELALEIMREGDAMLNPNPLNFYDYITIWSLASGYATVEPSESFPLIEDAIFRLNDTIAALVKVAEFIDVQGEIVIDNEIQVGVFGGSMIRNVLGVVDQSGGVIKSLAAEDFERTKGLAEKFQKPEVRILAKFIILRSVLENDDGADLGLIK